MFHLSSHRSDAVAESSGDSIVFQLHIKETPVDRFSREDWDSAAFTIYKDQKAIWRYGLERSYLAYKMYKGTAVKDLLWSVNKILKGNRVYNLTKVGDATMVTSLKTENAEIRLRGRFEFKKERDIISIKQIDCDEELEKDIRKLLLDLAYFHPSGSVKWEPSIQILGLISIKRPGTKIVPWTDRFPRLSEPVNCLVDKYDQMVILKQNQALELLSENAESPIVLCIRHKYYVGRFYVLLPGEFDGIKIPE